MNRDQDKLKARRAHVKSFVSKYNGKTIDAIKELSDALFLSETTIWKDLFYKEEKKPLKNH